MSLSATGRVVFCCGLLWATGGCTLFSASHDVYETIQANPHRKTALARKLNRQAIKQLEYGNPTLAQTTLHRALIADVSFGPAHNNLGRIHFDTADYYLAAWEFEYAARLMPNDPEPINNLGLVFETAGRFAEASTQYAAARELAPDHPEYLGNLVRAQLQQEIVDETVIEGLREIVLKDPRDDWREWADELLHTRFKDWPAGGEAHFPFSPRWSSPAAVEPSSPIELTPLPDLPGISRPILDTESETTRDAPLLVPPPVPPEAAARSTRLRPGLVSRNQERR